MEGVASEIIERARARVGATLLGKWHLDALLGVGGMASVFAATHRNGKRAALKILHPELLVNSSLRARFLREGYVANKVGHPGAVSILDDDTADDGSVFLVMELLEGDTIDRFVRATDPLPPDKALGITDQVLDVLAAAHPRGILHRDLKPANLFLTSEGQVKVLDFGIARLREPQSHGSAATTLSSMGTPGFMPPEQARGRWAEVDSRSDLWAVGATLFTLLTGRYVHEADTGNEQLLAGMTKPAEPLAKLAPELPRAVCELVDRALAFDPKDRFQSASEMQAAVRDAHLAITGRALEPSRITGSFLPRDSAQAQAPTLVATELPDGRRASRSPATADRDARRRGSILLAASVLVFVSGAGWLALRTTNASAPTSSSANAPSPPSTSVAGPSVSAAEPTATTNATAPAAVTAATADAVPTAAQSTTTHSSQPASAKKSGVAPSASSSTTTSPSAAPSVSAPAATPSPSSASSDMFLRRK